jgi:hypothetical protein
MDRSNRGPDPRSTGFSFSRRTILKSGVALGATASLAGCPETDGEETTETAEPNTSIDEFVADGLRIVETDIVSNEDGLGTFLRVVVENQLEHTISVVGLTAQFFDTGTDSVEFSDIHQASISGLAPGEAFEGYIKTFTAEPAAYVVHADRTRRRGDAASIDDVSVTHCREHRSVTGSVTNDGTEAVSRLRARATFYDEEGVVVGTGADTITRLGPGESAPFSVDFDRVVENDSVSVDEYTVSVGDYNDALLAVR